MVSENVLPVGHFDSFSFIKAFFGYAAFSTSIVTCFTHTDFTDSESLVEETAKKLISENILPVGHFYYMGSFTYYVINILAIFTPPPPPSSTVIMNQPPPPNYVIKACPPPPPPPPVIKGILCRKEGLPFATRARKRELSIQEVRIENDSDLKFFKVFLKTTPPPPPVINRKHLETPPPPSADYVICERPLCTWFSFIINGFHIWFSFIIYGFHLLYMIFIYYIWFSFIIYGFYQSVLWILSY